MFDLVGHKTQLYRGLGPAARYIRWLSLLMLPIWLALSVITVRSPTAFIDSYVCRNSDLKDGILITLKIIVGSITSYTIAPTATIYLSGFTFELWVLYGLFHFLDMKVAYNEMGKEDTGMIWKNIKLLCVSLTHYWQRHLGSYDLPCDPETYYGKVTPV